jgi:hypothetical protein
MAIIKFNYYTTFKLVTSINAAIALSKCSLVCAADNCTLIRALSFGTTGKEPNT